MNGLNGCQNKQHQPAKQETRCPPPKLMMFLGRKRGIKFFYKSPVFPGCAPSFISIQGRPTASQNWHSTTEKQVINTQQKVHAHQIMQSISISADLFFMFASCTIRAKHRATLSLSLKWDPRRCKHSMETAATASRRNSGPRMWLKPLPPHNFPKRRGPKHWGILRDSTCFFGECRIIL